VSSIPEFETITYEEADGVATVTLNRPDVHNAFNSLMQRELHTLWRALRRHDPVKCIVLTGAGEKAFCTGIDRMEQMGGESSESTDPDVVGSGSTPYMFNDPGDNIGPKSCDLWKPVIAAVNGMACGGAFYMLGEVEFIIAAEHAIAAIIASQPKLAIEGTVRAIWSTREMPQREAVRLGYAYVAMGTSQESIAEGQALFASGTRVKWTLR
jgi:1,4-dihydroxy-2-naphthoyl-CoA synthase